jgi:hypothetical protein
MATIRTITAVFQTIITHKMNLAWTGAVRKSIFKRVEIQSGAEKRLHEKQKISLGPTRQKFEQQGGPGKMYAKTPFFSNFSKTLQKNPKLN